MAKITVQTLGWREDDLTLGAIRNLRAAERIILRTARCGAADYLNREGIAFETFDSLYDQAEDFDALTDLIVKTLLGEKDDVLYGVCDPGDRTAQALVARPGADVCVYGGPQEGGALSTMAGGVYLQLNAIDARDARLDASQNVLIREIDNRLLAGEVKLRLMDYYPAEWEIVVSFPGGGLRRMPLNELDRLGSYDHRLCALIPGVESIKSRERLTLADLMSVTASISRARGMSLEAAPDDADPDEQLSSLSDALERIAFSAHEASLRGEFDLSDVVTSLIRRLVDANPELNLDGSALF